VHAFAIARDLTLQTGICIHMGLFLLQSPYCDRRLRSWNSRCLYQNAFIACYGADCQPDIRLFASSAWLLMPPPPLPASCPHTCTATGPLYSVITLNLSNLRCNYQKSPLLHKQFSHLSFLYHRNFNVVRIPTMTVHVSLISLCWCHC